MNKACGPCDPRNYLAIIGADHTIVAASTRRKIAQQQHYHHLSITSRTISAPAAVPYNISYHNRIMSDTVSRLLSKVHLGGDSSKDAPSDAAGGQGASARKRNQTSVNDGEDCGDYIEDDSLAGGGRAYGHNRTNVRVSEPMRRFLAQEGEIPDEAMAVEKSDALDVILKRPQVIVPDWVNDRSHPVSEYFISTSHNTYLSGRQLVGKSTTMTYTHTLRIGCRCVEIDAWDNEANYDEPAVTHGLTLSSTIPFRDVCQAIGDQVDAEIAEAKAGGTPLPLPVFISLENHCKERGQVAMYRIMQEVFGDKLVTQKIDTEAEPSIKDLEGKITVMVEYYGLELNSDAESISSSESSSDEEERAMKKKKEEVKPSKIVPELATLGVYAQSIKPKDLSWLKGELRDPHNHMINVSEGTVYKLLEKHDAKAMITHNAHHLIRVYPAGLRIDSTNLHPCPFWAVGAQVAALNTQTFDASMQINEAFFAGTAGYALKPASLRRDPPGPMPEGSVRVRLHIAGVSDLPVQSGREDDVKPYVTCTLHHGLSHRTKPEKRKTDVYKQHHHHPHLRRHPEMPPPTQPVWHETLEWTFDKAFFDLAVIRILIKSDDRWKENPVLCVAAMRALFAPKEWSFIRLLDLKGHETQSTMLAKFEIDDA
ncbi:hypothetical protein CF326_g2170 [Tilletia indica]|uniref:Phosphoinositide phospholipase C n=1 Tax=Tilletia indica TaxID=43049 RepID=A0A177TW56_9BASI|nr:hypothetical protein CF326_g2170 [Tilletia indica]KAE8257247.1 hypothetical protein A4X13_0g2481 [Tilletia indica]